MLNSLCSLSWGSPQVRTLPSDILTLETGECTFSYCSFVVFIEVLNNSIVVNFYSAFESALKIESEINFKE